MPPDPITINFDSLQSAVKKLHLPEEKINEILQLTAAKTARWAYSRLSSKLGKELKLDLKIRKGRLRLYVEKGSDGAQVWFGMDGISFSKFHPVQTSSGVHTDVLDIGGAFVGTGKGLGAGAVFKRAGASRLPIAKQFYDIQNVARPIFDQAVSEVVAQLGKNFERAYMQVLTK